MSFVKVDRNGRYTVETLYEWDKNQVLEISGLTVPNTPEIHFVNRSMTEAIVRQGANDESGIITVNIPNVILEKPLPIDVYICAYEGDLFRTLYKLQIPVKERQKPSDYIYDKEDEILSFNLLNNRLTDSIANMEAMVENALVRLDENNETFLSRFNQIHQDAVQDLTEAFDERVASLRADVLGDDVVSLEQRLKDMIQVKSGISIAPNSWSNKSYTITFDKIVDGSIVDVYYNQASKEAITDAEPTYAVGVGYLKITVNTVPTSAIVIDTIKVVNDI